MASILTGYWPSQLRFTNVSVKPGLHFIRRSADTLLANPVARRQVTPVPIDEPAPTLAKLLKTAGYHSITVAPYVFYLRSAGLTRDFDIVDDKPYRSGKIDGSGVVNVALVDRTIHFLDKNTNDSPFFAWIHFMDPHAPYLARDDVARNGTGEQRYDSELRFVDKEVGRLVTQLKRRGLLQNTILAIHADHGEEFRDHGGQFHATTLYNEVVQVPWLLRLPNAKHAGRVIEPAVSLTDLTPTMMDLLGIQSDAVFAGRSLWPVIEHGTHTVRPVVSECDRFGRSKRALVTGDNKVIVDSTLGTVEIYSHTKDPSEQNNLAADDGLREAMLSQLRSIEQTMLRHRASPTQDKAKKLPIESRRLP